MANLNWDWGAIPSQTDQELQYARGAESIHSALSDSDLFDLEYRPFDYSKPLPDRSNLKKIVTQNSDSLIIHYETPDGKQIQRFSSDDITPITEGDMGKANLILNALADAFENQNYHPSVKLSPDVKKAHTNFSRTTYRKHSTSLVLPMDILRQAFGEEAVGKDTKGLYTWGVPQAIFYDNEASVDEYIPSHIRNALEQTTGRTWQSLSEKEKQAFALFHEEGHRRTYDLLNKDYPDQETDYVQGREEADANAIAIRGMETLWTNSSSPSQNRAIDPNWFKTKTQPWRALRKTNNDHQNLATIRNWVQSRNTGNSEQSVAQLEKIESQLKKARLDPRYLSPEIVDTGGLFGSKAIQVVDRETNLPVNVRMVGGRPMVQRRGNRGGGFTMLPEAGSNQTNADLVTGMFQNKRGIHSYLTRVAHRGFGGDNGDMRAQWGGVYNTPMQQRRMEHSRIIPRISGMQRLNFLKNNRLFGGARSRVGLDAQGFMNDFAGWGGSNADVLRSINQPYNMVGEAPNYPAVGKVQKRIANMNRFDEQVGITTYRGSALPTRPNPFQQGAHSNVLLEASYMMGVPFAAGESEKIAGLGIVTPQEYEVDSSLVSGLQTGAYYGRKAPKGMNKSGKLSDLRRMGLDISSSADGYEILSIEDAGNGKSFVALGRHVSSTKEKSGVKPAHVARNASLMYQLGDAPSAMQNLSIGGRVHLQRRMTDDPLLNARRAMEGFRIAFGDDEYHNQLAQFVAEKGKDLEGQHIADAFAIKYFYEGLLVEGKKVGGFEWTRGRALVSASRLNNYMTFEDPQDATGYTKMQADNGRAFWARNITFNGEVRPVVENIEPSENGYMVTFNDLVNVSPVVADMSASFGKGVARVKAPSFEARSMTDATFARAIDNMARAHVGTLPEMYVVQADIANRSENPRGYLTGLGQQVIDIKDLDFEALEKQYQARVTPEMTLEDRAKLKMNMLGAQYKNAFLSVNLDGREHIIAPINQMAKSLTADKDKGGFVDNLSKSVMGLISNAELATVAPSDESENDLKQSLIDVINGQSSLAKTPNATAKAMSTYLPAFTGHASSARGLKDNEVVVWRSKYKALTGLSDEDIDQLAAEGKLGMMVTRYPETDASNASIGAKIRFADELTEKELKRMGITKDPDQMLLSETMWQAMVGDFDADQVSAIPNYMKADGKIVGGDINIHSESDIRKIAESRFGSEVAANMDKATKRANADKVIQEQMRMGTARTSLQTIEDQVRSGISAKGMIGMAYNFGVRGIAEHVKSMFKGKTDAHYNVLGKVATGLAQGIYQPFLDAKDVPGARELFMSAFGYYNIGKHTVGLHEIGKEGRTEMSYADANKHVMGLVSNFVQNYPEEERAQMARYMATMLMSPDQFKATTTSLDASSKTPSYENPVVDQLASELQNNADLTPLRMKEMMRMMVGDEEFGQRGVYGIFSSQDRPLDLNKDSMIGSFISGAVAQRTYENSLKYGHPFSALSKRAQQMAGFVGSTFQRVKSIIPEKNFRRMDKIGIEDVAALNRGTAIGNQVMSRIGSPTGLASIPDISHIAGSMPGVVRLGDNMLNVNGELWNTGYGGDLSMVDNEVRRFTSDNYISGSALNPEWGVSETPQQREMRLLAMRAMPKELISGPHSDAMGNYSERQQRMLENAMNLVRGGLGLSRKRLTSTEESLAGTQIHEQIQRALLGDAADIQHITYDTEERNGRKFTVPTIDNRARAEVRIVDQNTGISGTLDVIYNNTVLDIKSKKTFDTLAKQTSMGGYMHQLSAYHMMTVEGQGEVNGEKLLQSGIVPVSQREGLSAQERLAESVGVVKEFVSALEKARENKNVEAFKSIIEGAYGREYVDEAGFHMGKTIEYIKTVNNRLNKGGDWQIGMLPIFGQEAMDSGAITENLAKRMYDQDSALLSQVDRVHFDATVARKNLPDIASRILRSGNSVLEQLQRFRANKSGSVLLANYSGGYEDDDIQAHEDEMAWFNDGTKGRITSQGTLPKATVEKIESVPEGTRKSSPNIPNQNPMAMLPRLRDRDFEAFQNAMSRVFGYDSTAMSFDEDGNRMANAYEAVVSPARMRAMGMSDDDIDALGPVTPQELVQSPEYLGLRDRKLSRTQRAQYKQFSRGVYDLARIGESVGMSISRNQKMGFHIPAVVGKINEAMLAMPNMLRDQLTNITAQKGALESLYGGRGGDKSLNEGVDALGAFVDALGNGTEKFITSITDMAKGIDAGGATAEKALQQFEAWAGAFEKFNKAIKPAEHMQETLGGITPEMYESLRNVRGTDAMGRDGGLLANRTTTGYALNQELLDTTRQYIQGNLQTANEAYQKSANRRSQRSWQEMVGLSHEGAGITRKLSEAWGAPTQDGVFTEGAFAGQAKGRLFGARVSGMSALGAALNPYNMFAAQRVWRLTGGNAFGAMNEYQQYAVQQQSLSYYGGLINADDLIGGQYGTIMGRRGRQAEATLGLGKVTDRAYGWMRDLIVNPEGAGALAGVGLPSIGAGLGAAALFKGASALNIMAGGAGFAGLANPIGWGVAALVAGAGAFGYMSSGAKDLDALAGGDILAILGAALGLGGDNQLQRGSAYGRISKLASSGFRRGGFDSEALETSGYVAGLTADEIQQGIQRGFKEVYKDRAQKLYGENYETELMGTYRLGQLADPKFTMLANEQLTNRIMDLGAKYGGVEDVSKMMVGYGRAMGVDSPTVSMVNQASSYLENLGDPLVGMPKFQSMLDTMAQSNQYRTLQGQSALGLDYFSQFNIAQMPFVGQMQAQIAQTQFNSRYQTGYNIPDQINAALQSGDFKTANRLTSEYSLASNLSNIAQQQIQFMGGSESQQRVADILSSQAATYYGETGSQYLQGITPALTAYATRNTNISGYSADLDLIEKARNGDSEAIGQLQQKFPLAMISGANNFGDALSSFLNNAELGVTGSLESEMSALFASTSNFQAQGGNLDALIQRRMIQGGQGMGYGSYASASENVIDSLRNASPDQLQSIIAESMSADFLNQSDQFYGGWFGADTQGRTGLSDFTNPLLQGNMRQAQQSLDRFYRGASGLSAGGRSNLEIMARERGLGSEFADINLAGSMWFDQTVGGFNILEQQGFMGQDAMLKSVANINASQTQYPLVNRMLGMTGNALNASLYRTNRADLNAVNAAEAGILQGVSGLDWSNPTQVQNLMAQYGTEQFRLQAGIMGRTTGMGETAFLDASSLTNNDLMTQSIQSNAQQLFEAFSGVLIENASLSKQSQQAIADMTLGGLDYNDEYAVQGRVRGLGRYSSAMNMLGRYMATGTSVDQLSAVAMQTMGMDSQQFAQWQGMESQNPYVMSQNLAGAQARWGAGAVPIAPINLQTGQATTLTQLAPGGNMGFVNALRGQNSLFKGAFLADYMTDDWLANIGGTAGIQGEIMNLQMSTQGASAGHGRRMLNLRNMLNRGGGTLDAQGYVVGGSLQPFQQQMQAAGYNINIGNGMSMWQIQDRRDQMSREMQMWDMARQGRDKDMQRRHFYDNWNLGYRQWDYQNTFQWDNMQIARQQQLTQRAWTQDDMAFSRNQQVTQFAWQREDMAFGRARNALEFGWQTEDFERNKRYARGRDRINLLREQERANIRYNMDVGQADKQEARQQQQAQWAQEQFDKQQARFAQQVIWEEERYARESDHFHVMKAFELEKMEMEKRHFEERMGLADEDFEKKKAHALEMMALEDQERLMSRQTSEAFADMDQRFSEAMAGAQKKIAELSNLLTGIGQTDNATSALLKLKDVIDAPAPTWMESLWMNVQDERGMEVFVPKGKDEQLETSDGGFIGDLEGMRAEFDKLRGSVDPLSKGVSTLGNHSTKTMNQLEELIKRVEFVGGSSQKYAQSLSIVNTQMAHASAGFDNLVNSLSRMAGVGGAGNIDMLRDSFERLTGVTPTLNSAIMSTHDVLGTFGGRIKDLANAVSQSIAQLNSAINNVPSGTKGYAEGGYTGDGGKYQVAGIVHKGEYVVPREGVPVIRDGDSQKEMIMLLKGILRELSEIRKLGPGRINMNLVSPNPEVMQRLITDESRVRAIR